MELQVKTAMQMRDQGHALKQKALDLVSEAEQKVRKSRPGMAEPEDRACQTGVTKQHHIWLTKKDR